MSEQQQPAPVYTMEEAREHTLQGWNICCNRCGSFGASWISGQRPGWGALALCPPHQRELYAELNRHREALATLRQVRYEQPTPWAPGRARAKASR